MARYGTQTALIVVDVQNDFAEPSGSLYVSGGERVVPAINEEIAKAKAAGAFIVYTQDWHPLSTPHFQKDGGVWPVHCVHDSWGAQLAPGLEVAGPVVQKGQGGEDGYSGFSMANPETGEKTRTGLAEILRARRVDNAVVVGLATDYCVKATAFDAVGEGYPVTVVRHCVRAVDLQPGDGQRALDEMEQAGVKLE